MDLMRNLEHSRFNKVKSDYSTKLQLITHEHKDEIKIEKPKVKYI